MIVFVFWCWICRNLLFEMFLRWEVQWSINDSRNRKNRTAFTDSIERICFPLNANIFSLLEIFLQRQLPFVFLRDFFIDSFHSSWTINLYFLLHSAWCSWASKCISWSWTFLKIKQRRNSLFQIYSFKNRSIGVNLIFRRNICSNFNFFQPVVPYCMIYWQKLQHSPTSLFNTKSTH